MQPNYDHLTRQLDLIPLMALNRKITVIGAGAIGSFTVLNLVKMGFTDVTVYDFDSVSIENMNCQWYRKKDIGKPKVLALKEIILDFTDVPIEIRQLKWNGTQDLEGIVISAVDSMEVRRQIWKHCFGNYKVEWLIDPRMAAEYALMYTIDPSDEKDQKTYEATLYSDSESVQEACTAKATMYTATMISGHVAKAVKDIVTGGKYARSTAWDIALNNQLTWPKKPKETSNEQG